ncbi:MAG: HAD family hydrolase [Roseiarcus sp.]
MLSTLLFDMNDVLCRYDRAARIATLAAISGRTPDFVEAAIWRSGFEDRGDEGAFSAEAYLGEFGERLGFALRREQWIEAQRAAIAPLPEALALAARLGENYTLAVLTNNNLLVLETIDAFFPELRPIFGPRIFVSAQFSARKPDPIVYLRCLARLGVEPGSALFIDDSAKNVAGAEAAGLIGHLYTGAEALDAAVTELEAAAGFSPRPR